MKEFNIFNANQRNNPSVEKLLTQILKPLNLKPIFYNSLESIGTLENGETLPVKIDLIYFDGGEDVTPYRYGDIAHPKTYVNEKRDSVEISNYKLLKKSFPNLPCLGICRGAQMLTVLSKGKLIQHVENHGSDHYITSPQFDKNIMVTSTHHQMMYPFNLEEQDYKIIGFSKKILSNIHETVDGDGNVCNIKYPKDFVEPEIVFYEKTNALCIQGHPEYPHATKQFVEFTKELILRLLYNKL